MDGVGLQWHFPGATPPCSGWLGGFLRMTSEPQWPSCLGWGLESGSPGVKGASVGSLGFTGARVGSGPILGCNEASLLEPRDH